jgi:hypothetical protein
VPSVVLLWMVIKGIVQDKPHLYLLGKLRFRLECGWAGRVLGTVMAAACCDCCCAVDCAALDGDQGYCTGQTPHVPLG